MPRQWKVFSCYSATMPILFVAPPIQSSSRIEMAFTELIRSNANSRNAANLGRNTSPLFFGTDRPN